MLQWGWWQWWCWSRSARNGGRRLRDANVLTVGVWIGEVLSSFLLKSRARPVIRAVWQWMSHSQIRHSFTSPGFFRACANCKLQLILKARFAFANSPFTELGWLWGGIQRKVKKPTCLLIYRPAKVKLVSRFIKIQHRVPKVLQILSFSKELKSLAVTGTGWYGGLGPQGTEIFLPLLISWPCPLDCLSLELSSLR